MKSFSESRFTWASIMKVTYFIFKSESIQGYLSYSFSHARFFYSVTTYRFNQKKGPGYNILRMYWTIIWQPTVFVQDIFEKTLLEVCSPHLYASFGTFCVQIGQSFEAQWVFEVCLKILKSLLSKQNVVDFRKLPNV